MSAGLPSEDEDVLEEPDEDRAGESSLLGVDPATLKVSLNEELDQYFGEEEKGAGAAAAA